ncbi:MAG: restriction endonuclease subunit S [Candidatus Tenebribacter davisii]|nr:restriction endonuclease subunit S [Candidatus Tenebribacter davisii]
MSEWKNVKLGDILTLQRGHDLPKSQMKPGNIPVAGSNGIIGYHDDSTTKAPGVTIGRSGNLGNAHLYTKDFWAHNTTLYVKDFKENDQIFVYYLLKSINFKQFNVGSAVPTLNRNHIHPLPINLPPLPEQKAIAEVLSSLDDKIDLLHRQNKTLEAMAETLFRQWFVEKADESWEEKSLSFFGEIVCGKTPSKKRKEFHDGSIPFIKIPDMHHKTFVFSTVDTLTEEGKNSQIKKTLPEKSICVSCIATVGLVTFTTEESHTNQQINSIIPFKSHYRYYLYLQMRSSYDLLHALASGGTATLNLNTGNFSKINIPLPGDKKLKEFHNSVEPKFDKIYSNQKQIITLKKLRDTLLPKLMSGKVRVEI